MSPKEVVQKFYNSDLANNSEAVDLCFHKDCSLSWHSSKGFNVLDFEALKLVFEEVRKMYDTLRFETSHLLAEGNMVTIRYTSYFTTVENPNEEMPLAHFTTIWEVKDDKIIKGFQMSQLADSSSESLNSF
ncbi:nuclear transport factor 2 family protein [Lacinutrix himadriensis]|uniref:nuclear transport factor 2 family protein n=1 Tax=Lacinutrix himadriensis TaxID=641549 RepID=UPI0006E3577A|nr:nuclear transport factor 2 family protein [Lacinutrix himadriensis]